MQELTQDLINQHPQYRHGLETLIRFGSRVWIQFPNIQVDIARKDGITEILNDIYLLQLKKDQTQIISFFTFDHDPRGYYRITSYLPNESKSNILTLERICKTKITVKDLVRCLIVNQTRQIYLPDDYDGEIPVIKLEELEKTVQWFCQTGLFFENKWTSVRNYIATLFITNDYNNSSLIHVYSSVSAANRTTTFQFQDVQALLVFEKRIMIPKLQALMYWLKFGDYSEVEKIIQRSYKLKENQSKKRLRDNERGETEKTPA
jgi:hypothetical protein